MRTSEIEGTNDVLGVCYSRQQNYSSACDNICVFFLVCLRIFIISCYELYKTIRFFLEKYLFHKTALCMTFMTRNISSARIILL